MKSPVLNLDLAGNNISGFVESFKYEDTMDKDNVLSFSIKEELVLLFLNDSTLQEGAELIFNFGYVSGALSETHKAIISDIETSYNDGGITATIKAIDKGHFVKKTSSPKIWKAYKTSDIAKEIASKYSLGTSIEDTSKEYPNLPQGNLSDFEFLQELADKENNYVFFVRNNVLHFEERGLEKPSVLTFTFGASNVILFRPSSKLSKTSGVGDNTELSTFDSNAKTSEPVLVDDANEENATTTKGVFINSDKGELIGNKKIVKGTDDKEEATNVSNNIKKKDALQAQQATMTIEGIPTLVPNTVITIENVAVRHLGNWLVTSVGHTISNSGYRCNLKMTARGSRSGDTMGTSTNKTVGGSEVNTSKQVPTRKINSDTGELIN